MGWGHWEKGCTEVRNCDSELGQEAVASWKPRELARPPLPSQLQAAPEVGLSQRGQIRILHSAELLLCREATEE